MVRKRRGKYGGCCGFQLFPGAFWATICWAFFNLQEVACGRGWLLIGSPSQNKIVYSLLPTFDEAVARTQQDNETDTPSGITSEVYDLVTTLQKPRSMYAWSSGAEHYLYVYDEQTQNIYKMRLLPQGDTLLAEEPGTAVVENVQVTALTVDERQNLYYSRPNNWIQKQAFDQVDSPVTLFSEESSVNSVTAFTNDGLYLYWGNALTGSSSGSVVKAPTKLLTESTSFPKKLAVNTADSNGVCISQDNIFYTSGTNIWITKKNNTKETDPAMIFWKSGVAPQRCFYDAVQSALYVADNNGVYEFPGNFGRLREIRTPIRVLDFDGAKEVAVVRSNAYSSLGSFVSRTYYEMILCHSLGLCLLWAFVAS